MVANLKVVLLASIFLLFFLWLHNCKVEYANAKDDTKYDGTAETSVTIFTDKDENKSSRKPKDENKLNTENITGKHKDKSKIITENSHKNKIVEDKMEKKNENIPINSIDNDITLNPTITMPEYMLPEWDRTTRFEPLEPFLPNPLPEFTINMNELDPEPDSDAEWIGTRKPHIRSQRYEILDVEPLEKLLPNSLPEFTRNMNELDPKPDSDTEWIGTRKPHIRSERLNRDVSEEYPNTPSRYYSLPRRYSDVLPAREYTYHHASYPDHIVPYPYRLAPYPYRLAPYRPNTHDYNTIIPPTTEKRSKPQSPPNTAVRRRTLSEKTEPKKTEPKKTEKNENIIITDNNTENGSARLETGTRIYLFPAGGYPYQAPPYSYQAPPYPYQAPPYPYQAPPYPYQPPPYPYQPPPYPYQPPPYPYTGLLSNATPPSNTNTTVVPNANTMLEETFSNL